MSIPQGPFGFLMPVGGFGQPPAAQPASARDSVPARVRAAVEILEMLTEKTEAEVFVSSSMAGTTDFERFPGQKLSDEELNLQAVACNMLAKYLAGELKPTEQEKAKGEQWQCMGCPFCGGGRGPDGKKCAICSGGGSIAVAPIHSPK